jgi:RHS repeat-associated protein
MIAEQSASDPNGVAAGRRAQSVPLLPAQRYRGLELLHLTVVSGTQPTCDNTRYSTGLPNNGFTAASAYVLGPHGEQMTEMTNTAAGGQAPAWQWLHTGVMAPGLSATYDADLSGATEGWLYFHLSDWLGTRRQQTDYAGNPCLDFTGLPFGDGLATVPVSSTACGDATEQHFTGKERDAESGNDYFGARYYASSMGRFMSPDWSAKVMPVPYANLGDPQSLNLYSYVLNNPLIKVDPTGHDWFYVDKKWQWQKGSTYHDKDGNATKDKGYAGLLVAQKYGTDSKTGASLYHITLYNQDKVAGTADGFSGGNGHTPVGDGNYMLRLDIRDATGPNHINPASPLGNPDRFSGVQQMHNIPLNDGTGREYNVIGAYGFVRAFLNGSDGDYVHGQYPPHNWTHGCLSYGANYDFGQALWNMPAHPTPAAIDVPAEKP